MFNHENLKGRVAVVTGGGGVLCGGFAKTDNSVFNSRQSSLAKRTNRYGAWRIRRP